MVVNLLPLQCFLGDLQTDREGLVLYGCLNMHINGYKIKLHVPFTHTTEQRKTNTCSAQMPGMALRPGEERWAFGSWCMDGGIARNQYHLMEN
jgi:hypothetical protein